MRADDERSGIGLVEAPDNLRTALGELGDDDGVVDQRTERVDAPVLLVEGVERHIERSLHAVAGA